MKTMITSRKPCPWELSLKYYPLHNMSRPIVNIVAKYSHNSASQPHTNECGRYIMPCMHDRHFRRCKKKPHLLQNCGTVYVRNLRG